MNAGRSQRSGVLWLVSSAVSVARAEAAVDDRPIAGAVLVAVAEASSSDSEALLRNRSNPSGWRCAGGAVS